MNIKITCECGNEEDVETNKDYIEIDKFVIRSGYDAIDKEIVCMECNKVIDIRISW